MGKTKGLRAKFKQRRSRKRHEEAQANKPEGTGAGPQALAYLAEWARRSEGGWKFNKTRQTYLLKHWPNRDRIPGDEFKQLLAYMLSLPAGGRQRTIEQARGVAEEAERQDREEGQAQAAREAGGDASGGDAGEGEDDDVQAEAQASAQRRALLKIRRARALKVLQTLMASAAGGVEEGGPG
jgi:hypothetical protein